MIKIKTQALLKHTGFNFLKHVKLILISYLLQSVYWFFLHLLDYVYITSITHDVNNHLINTSVTKRIVSHSTYNIFKILQTTPHTFT